MTVRDASLAAAAKSATLEALDERSTFDAIVVGAGAAGGMAAMLLSEAGMNVLLLDASQSRGFREAPVRSTISKVVPWLAMSQQRMPLPDSVTNVGRKALKAVGKIYQPVQSRSFAWELAPHAFVDDRECPYETLNGTRFDWFRARQLGGRMVVPGHGRLYFRLSERDLASWPFEPGELDPWYNLVEERLGLAGMAENSPWVPDSRLRDVIEPTTAELELQELISSRWPGYKTVLGRAAPPHPSVAAAAATGRLSLRCGAIVRQVLVDASGRAEGVAWFDLESRQTQTAKAPIVFVCASSLETTRILLLTRPPNSPDGLGAVSASLGRYLMDHVVVSGQGVGPALPQEPVPMEPGRCVYAPRFDLRDAGRSESGAGYGIQLYRWSVARGKSAFNAVGFAEMTARPENRVLIDPHVKDAWGIPVLRIGCTYSAEELVAARDQSTAIHELAELARAKLTRIDTKPAAPGTAMHECGTARMGDSPATSVLDPDNQCWHVKGLYVTDGAAFPSQGTQNPTLTILAVTARACAHVVRAAGACLAVLWSEWGSHLPSLALAA